MNYFTGLATGPAFEFPYSGYQSHSIGNFDNDIDSILASIASPIGTQVYSQPPTVTLQCVPQINTGVSNNTIVYQVPENMPIDTILQQLGINTNTLHSSSAMHSYYQPGLSQPIEFVFPPPTPQRHRRLVCREVSDSEDEGYLRRPSRRRHSSPDQPQQPVALHNLLSRVWQSAERGSQNLPSSFSAPDLNSPWRNRSPPPNANTGNIWQAMRNASPQMPPDNRNAINNVWQRADNATEQRSNLLSNMFNRMQQPTGNINQPLQNREAVHDFNAARNLPYGVNAIPPNREAVQDFNAARNLPYGVNAIPPNREAVHDFNAIRNLPFGVNAGLQNREAVHDFNAIRNLPFGINTGPQNREAVHDFNAIRNLPFGVNTDPQNREAVNNFLSARNVPFGMNTGPQNREAVNNFLSARNVPFGMNTGPQNREAANNFLSARNVPFGVNQPNPAIANVWNRADNAVHQGPPMINVPYNRPPQGPPFLGTSTGFPSRGPSNLPAPTSFASILAQAHRQHLPYAGGV